LNITGFLNSLVSKDYSFLISQKIKKDKTFDKSYYLLNKTINDFRDYGTSHMSAMDKKGNSIALTTTVNLNFGSKFSSKTGIVLNNQMDDFSSLNRSNSFGFTPSLSNIVEPFKTPMSKFKN
jgi:gamma-glutamyltranspeptidase / glutathione hydrolase / leukotriene-C4 hydrolase